MNCTTPFALDQRTPIPFTDEHGVPCYQVPMGREDHPFVPIWKEDYHFLVDDLGASPVWSIDPDGKGHWYVILNFLSLEWDGTRTVPVARLIMGAGPKQCVRYVTRDTLDLRRSNLRVQQGPGRYDSIELILTANRKRKQWGRTTPTSVV